MDRKRLIYGTGAAVLAGGLLASSLVYAQAPTADITPDQATAAALAQFPGSVLEIELEREDGRTVYEVEIWPQAGGRVVEVMVDASTGVVLGTEVDDDDDELEFSGPIESLPATGAVGAWQVGGRIVHVGASTEFDGDAGQLAVGSLVEIEGVPRADGSLDATEIELDDGRGDDDDDDDAFEFVEGLFEGGR